jgi:transposase
MRCRSAGVGPLTALAVEAFAPAMQNFKRGRDFAAWLGLVPRQHSSGGKERLGRVSKAGQTDIRRLLIIGAMSRLNWMGRKTIAEGSSAGADAGKEATHAGGNRVGKQDGARDLGHAGEE